METQEIQNTIQRFEGVLQNFQNSLQIITDRQQIENQLDQQLNAYNLVDRLNQLPLKQLDQNCKRKTLNLTELVRSRMRQIKEECLDKHTQIERQSGQLIEEMN